MSRISSRSYLLIRLRLIRNTAAMGSPESGLEIFFESLNTRLDRYILSSAEAQPIRHWITKPKISITSADGQNKMD
jgi:hypothetical protein